ncbi:DinB family protein [Chitinophaga qingshengii]|uniref:DinB family protein n=1 Tax=Chitinophaga qingshengii TaxID=1569794 RepID=A0ABR7TIG7_9BACT|nr:DinB family protein [Chitinophaga qingshengii]MBC9928869.1 DinB family protein [Chitinophaga qingshengii]
MIADSLQRWEYLCDTIPALLNNIPEEEFSFKPLPAKWSKKEILGHLIDSAANNHQRFVRVQFEETPRIGYQQNEWNHYSYHQQQSGRQLIDSWLAYNRLLLGIAGHIPEALLQRTCYAGGTEPVTLDFVIRDYVTHLEHHLRQLTIY